MTTKAKVAKKSTLIASNKKAFHEYHILETFKAGIVLTGTEIKSIRLGKLSLNESHARIEKAEILLYGMQITPYDAGSYNNHKPDRVRKLLLTRKEINKLIGKMKESGLTLVPLRIYFDRCWVKLDLGLAKGKKLYDKRDDIQARDTKRTIARAMKSSGRDNSL
jgi:SsrA-binding protein